MHPPIQTAGMNQRIFQKPSIDESLTLIHQDMRPGFRQHGDSHFDEMKQPALMNGWIFKEDIPVIQINVHLYFNHHFNSPGWTSTIIGNYLTADKNP